MKFLFILFFFCSCFLFFFRSVLFIQRVTSYPLSSCHLLLYNTQHNTAMPPTGYEPVIAVDEQLQTYAIDRAAM